jgi:hypothetical protein
LNEQNYVTNDKALNQDEIREFIPQININNCQNINVEIKISNL